MAHYVKVGYALHHRLAAQGGTFGIVFQIDLLNGSFGYSIQFQSLLKISLV